MLTLWRNSRKVDQRLIYIQSKSPRRDLGLHEDLLGHTQKTQTIKKLTFLYNQLLIFKSKLIFNVEHEVWMRAI